MKKSRMKTVSHALFSAAFRGFAVFAIFGMSLYAYAITYPASQPNAVSGIVGIYVGKTTVENGAQTNYAAANDLCANSGGALLEDSHICTSMEIINSYNHDPSSPLNSETASLWINSNAPGTVSAVTNDCNGWSISDSKVFGSVWNADKKASFITTCSLSRSFACCK